MVVFLDPLTFVSVSSSVSLGAVSSPARASSGIPSVDFNACVFLFSLSSCRGVLLPVNLSVWGPVCLSVLVPLGCWGGFRKCSLNNSRMGSVFSLIMKYVVSDLWSRDTVY